MTYIYQVNQKKGREYYSFLCSIKKEDNSGPSIYDEASMANDIGTMKEN